MSVGIRVDLPILVIAGSVDIKKQSDFGFSVDDQQTYRLQISQCKGVLCF